jgi:ABC-2 type transport system ATP-binding protein
LFKMSGAERRQRSAELIEMVGLKTAKRRQLKEYSKGMTRRIGLAQALINNPDLILLDEPTSGLDPLGSRDMKDLILKLKGQGKTIVMCSHLLADVQDVCDRIAILYQGELKVLDRVDDLLRDQEMTQIRASKLPPEAVKEIEAIAMKYGSTIHEIGQPQNTLEELFLKVIRESSTRPGQRFVNPSVN